MTIVLSESMQDIVHRQLDNLSAILSPYQPDILAADFLSRFGKPPPYAQYHYLPDKCQHYLEELKKQGGPDLAKSFLKYTLAFAIPKSLHLIEQSALPRSILHLYPRHLDRIINELQCQSDNFYSVSCDRFVKDLCLLTLRLYPVGARLIQPGCGVPRRLAWQGGLVSSAAALHRFLVRARGFRPFLQSHIHTSDLADFNPDGMIKTYLRIAELLRINPGCLGYCTASWFNDPQVWEVSPRLAYLSQIPVEGGAFLLRGVADANNTAAALARSPTRRYLHSIGQYTPCTYYCVWPRAAMLRWAAAQDGSLN